MNRIWIPLALAAGLAMPAQAQHWGYEGHEGPEHWQEMNPDWAVCAVGQQQSPVDLTQALQAGLGTPEIDWAEETAGVVVDNGHTIQVSVESLRSETNQFVARCT